jgi:two-component sensor histidine kinase
MFVNNRYTEEREIVLLPSDEFMIKYNLIFWGNESDLKQKYIIINEHNDTSHFNVGKNGIIKIKDIGSNKYTLQIVAELNGKSYTSVPVHFVVKSYWYNAKWFYVLLTSLIVFIIIMIYSNQSKIQERRNKLLEEKVAMRTNELKKETEELNKSNKTILQKNIEKDAMLQEIHHRVKNNLHFIAGMIEMQINADGDEKSDSALYDISKRITAMSLVHDLLYDKDNLQFVSAKMYIEELVNSIDILANYKTQSIKFEIEIDEIVFNISQCISVGMIVSELVSNSIKHAFENVAIPTITIHLKTNEKTDKMELEIWDNGKGFSHNLETNKGMGLRLIDIFSRQLNGLYSFENKEGMKYSLHFFKYHNHIS